MVIYYWVAAVGWMWYANAVRFAKPNMICRCGVCVCMSAVGSLCSIVWVSLLESCIVHDFYTRYHFLCKLIRAICVFAFN